MRKLLAISVVVAFMLSAFMSPVVYIIKGTIKNENGNALPNVIIMEKGSRSGVRSASDGSYSISVSNDQSTLLFSAIGYESQEVRIESRATIDVILKATQKSLQEVVITGHGTALQGKVAGVQTQDNATRSQSVKIRGTSSGFYPQASFNTEAYDPINENGFHKVSDDPLSTFSIDVDAASYSNVRRFLNNNQLPPAGAIRTEEMINYFTYNYPQPAGSDPFSITTEMSD